MATTKVHSKIAALKKEYEEKYAAELDNLKRDVEGLLENLNEILQSIDGNDRTKILKGAKIAKLIAAFGINPVSEPVNKTKRKNKTSRAELTEDAVKAFIGKGTKTKSELSSHFKGGNVKVVKFLDAMVKAKHLDTNNTKSKKNKDVTNYSVK